MAVDSRVRFRPRLSSATTTPSGTASPPSSDVRAQGLGAVWHRVVPVEDRLGMLTALAEGVSVAVATRIFGHSEFTIQTWLTRNGMHVQSIHERLLRGLHLGHVQLDEVRTAIRQGSQIVWV